MMRQEPERKIGTRALRRLRDAIIRIPFFDGERESLSRYLAKLEEAREVLGPELRPELLMFAKVKLSSEVRHRLSTVDFNGIEMYVAYLKITYDPPTGVFELVDELQSLVRKCTDSADSFARKVDYLAHKIIEMSRHEDGPGSKVTKEWVEALAQQCLQKGLMTGQITIRAKSPDTSNIKLSEEPESSSTTADVERVDSTKRTLEKSDEPTTDKRVKIISEETITESIKQTTKSDIKVICQLCGDEGHGADTCLSIDSATVSCSSSEVVVCWRCKEKGHEAVECRNRTRCDSKKSRWSQKICRSCGKAGHRTENCQPVPCPICGRRGHFENTCRSRVVPPLMGDNSIMKMRPYEGKQKADTRPPIRCFACNERGHIARNCHAIHNIKLNDSTDYKSADNLPMSSGFDNSTNNVSNTLSPNSFVQPPNPTGYPTNFHPY